MSMLSRAEKGWSSNPLNDLTVGGNLACRASDWYTNAQKITLTAAQFNKKTSAARRNTKAGCSVLRLLGTNVDRSNDNGFSDDAPWIAVVQLIRKNRPLTTCQ